jgi:hypothetical protein
MGGSRRSNLTPTRDIHGNNSSHRLAKVRLHNVLIALEDISVKEQAWEIDHPVRARLRSAIVRLEGKDQWIKHSATSALFYLYNETVEQGFMSRVEKSCVRFMRKRGRDWKVSADPDYPSSDSECEPEDAHKRFRANPAQRNFIATSNILNVSTDVQDKPRSPKRRRVDDNLAFNEEIYVRSGADVDDIWPASSTRNANSLKPTSSPPSVLHTSVCKAKRRRIDPDLSILAPANPYTRPLEKLAEPRRSIRWHRGRRARETGVMCSKGLWTVPKNRVNVNTSGYEFGKNYEGWEKYVEELEEEAENWMMDWELDEHMRKPILAHLVSDGDTDDEAAGDMSENFL